jgi:hypothetical protein
MLGYEGWTGECAPRSHRPPVTPPNGNWKLSRNESASIQRALYCDLRVFPHSPLSVHGPLVSPAVATAMSPGDKANSKV